jgi:hypothetical protein
MKHQDFDLIMLVLSYILYLGKDTSEMMGRSYLTFLSPAGKKKRENTDKYSMARYHWNMPEVDINYSCDNSNKQK